MVVKCPRTAIEPTQQSQPRTAGPGLTMSLSVED